MNTTSNINLKVLEIDVHDEVYTHGGREEVNSKYKPPNTLTKTVVKLLILAAVLIQLTGCGNKNVTNIYAVFENNEIRTSQFTVVIPPGSFSRMDVVLFSYNNRQALIGIEDLETGVNIVVFKKGRYTQDPYTLIEYERYNTQVRMVINDTLMTAISYNG